MSKRQYAGVLRSTHENETVMLKGWVDRRRDLGELIFIDLRDASGIVQLVFNPVYSKDSLEIAEKLRSEYVIQVEGKVIKRDAETINPNVATGENGVTRSDVSRIDKSNIVPVLLPGA